MPGYPRPSAPIPRSLAEIAARLGDARVVEADTPGGGVVRASVMVTGHHPRKQRGPPGRRVRRSARRTGARVGVRARGRRGRRGRRVHRCRRRPSRRRGGTARRSWCRIARAALGPAAAAIYGEPAARLTLIGITGTAGKTSTAYLIESGLRAAGHVTGLIGTVETRLGDLVVDSVRTTPEATDLHGLFAAAVERGVDRGGDGGVEPRAGAWTASAASGSPSAATRTSGSDHLDFHRDADDYFAAKAKLFDGRCDVEILNADDPALKPLYKAATVTYLGRWRRGGDLAGGRRAAGRVRPAVHRVRPGGCRGGRRCTAAWPAQCRQCAARHREPGRRRSRL